MAGVGGRCISMVYRATFYFKVQIAKIYEIDSLGANILGEI